MTEDINLKINGKKISLNDLMESMLNNLILGYLKSVKGVPEDIKQINIEIKL
ncbi:MAG TPA: hypothetical protein VGB37_00845 [Candidatus Lokiarchaeia archaeon]